MPRGARDAFARTLQAVGLFVTLAALGAGIGLGSMSLELTLLLAGSGSFLIGRTLARGEG